LKVEGKRILEESGVVQFPCSAQRAVEAKERTAVAMPDSLILRDGGRPACVSKKFKEERNPGGRR
jgi:hypothetical protein